jgi:hypothetical protein
MQKKQMLSMLSSDSNAQEIADWLSDSKFRDDVQQWFIRNYRQNPNIWNEDSRQKVLHYKAMAHIPAIDKLRLDKTHSFEDGLKLWKDAEDRHVVSMKERLVVARKKDKPFITINDGLAWYSLGVSSCADEGRAMGHCGNEGDPHKNDRLFSLRCKVVLNGRTFYEPHLTFVYNNGWLGEMKGYKNSRPSSKFHDAIIELLKHPKIKGLTGGAYTTNSDFHFDDLTNDQQNHVLAHKPDFIDFRSNRFAKIIARRKHEIPLVPKMRYQLHSADTYRRVLSALSSNCRKLPNICHNYYAIILSDEHIKSLIKQQHIDHITQEAPRYVAMYLCDHPLLNQQHVDHIVQATPGYAAMHLKDHPLFNQQHIDYLVMRSPENASVHLQNHPLLNQQHVDYIVQKEPWVAAECFKEHPMLNQQHIDYIVQEEPWTAVEFLKDHPMLNQRHIDYFVQEVPRYAAECLKEHPLLNQQHIDHIVREKPEYAAECLKDHPLLNQQHVDYIVTQKPAHAAQYFQDQPLLNQQHIDYIVAQAPVNASMHLKEHPLFNRQHIDYIVRKEPTYAARYLESHPLYTRRHARYTKRAID